MLKKKLNKKGFSLIELIIVIAIMAILAAIIVPTVINKVQEANESAAKTEVSNIATAIQQEIVEIQANSNAAGLVYLQKNGDNIVLKDASADGKRTEGKSTIELEGDTITITNSEGAEYNAEINIKTGKVKYGWNSGTVDTPAKGSETEKDLAA